MENIHNSMVVLKIHEGTPRSDVNLCPTCVHSHVFTTAAGDKQVNCLRNYYAAMRLREAVVTCNSYLDRTKPSLAQMEEIAWSLMTDKGGRKLGFAPPERRDGGSAPIGF